MKHKIKPIRVTIGIPAYNAEKNIRVLILSMLNQKEDYFVVDKIILHSDNSSDRTLEIAREIKNSKLTIMSSKKQLGFAKSVKKIIDKNRSDIIVLLNDDIKIYDNEFISKIVDSFRKNRNIGLVCGHPLPLKPINFIDAAITSGFNAYDKTRYSVRFGQNVNTVDGKCMAISKQFKQKITFNKEMGNLDGYLYFLCVKNCFEYKNIESLKIYYRNPTNYNEYIKWYVRNSSNKYILHKQFGDLVGEEYALPKYTFLKYKFIELLKNPIGCLFIFATSFYVEKQANIYKEAFPVSWDVVTTSKDLNI